MLKAAEHRVTVTYDDADMTRPEAIAPMPAKAIERFGAVDVLVNNAGVQEVSALVVLLCSKEAASITGAVLPIDGGWTAQ